MEGTHRRRPGIARRSALALVLALALTAVACGEEEGPKSFSDKEITEALSLEDAQGVLAVDGDIFCEVKPALLNDSDEVTEALDRNEGLVLTSIQGNVGIQVVPPFAPDCEAKVRRLLKDLDPTARQERRERREGGGAGDGGGDQGGGGSSDSEPS